jgi:hypothetical protein
MRRFWLLSVSLAAFMLPAADAVADEVIGTVARPTPVSAHAGRIVWSAYDPAQQAFFLTQRVGGVTSRVPVRPRSVPFDADLGPDVNGETVAAYSRCAREPRPRDPRIGNVIAQMPDWSRGRGCDLYRFDFATGRETRIATANSPGASEFLPSVWKATVAFARVYERKPGLKGERAYLYARPIAGATRSRRLIAGSRSDLRFCTAVRPRRCTRIVEPGPTALDLFGRRLAFGWDSGANGSPTSAVYLETLFARRVERRRLDRVDSGEIQGAELLSPQIDQEGRVVWGRVLFGDETSSRVRRYRISSRTVDVATLQPAPGEAFIRAALATAVDGSEILYLASGLTVPGEPCTPQAPCAFPPGCADSQPCELRRAGPLVFAPPPRQ